MYESTIREIAVRLDNILLDREISYRKAERICGIGQGVIRKFISEYHIMRLDNFLKICNGLQLDPEYLIYGIDINTIKKKIIDAGGCDARDEYSKGWDDAITEALSKFEER